MDVIIDVLVESVFHLFGEGFVSLCLVFVPNKTISDKTKEIISIVSVFIALALLVGLVIGIVLLVETQGNSTLGWIFISLASVYVLLGIIFKIVSVFKR